VIARVDIRLLLANVIAASLLLSLMSVLVAQEPARLIRSQQQQQGELVEIGALIYAQNCQSCHGIRGEGVGQLGPALNDAHFFEARLQEVGWLAGLENYVYGTTANGRMMGTRPFYAGNGSTAVMPPWHEQYGGSLRTDQIHAVTQFVLNYEATAKGRVVLQELQFTPLKTLAPVDAVEGRAAFLRHCARCHISRDAGGAEIAGPDLSDIQLRAMHRQQGLKLAEYIRESVLLPGKYVVEGYESLAEESGCGGSLATSELESIVAYLQ